MFRKKAMQTDGFFSSMGKKLLIGHSAGNRRNRKKKKIVK